MTHRAADAIRYRALEEHVTRLETRAADLAHDGRTSDSVELLTEALNARALMIQIRAGAA